MFNKAKRAIAIMLALVLVFALAGCKQPVDDGSSIEYIYEDQIVYVSGESTGSEDDGAQTQTPGTSSNKPGTPGTSSNKPGTPGTSSDQTPTDDKGYSNSPVLANPDDYRGTKIILATTIHPKDEGTYYVIENFEKEYGIKVDVLVTTSGDFNGEVTALIAAGKSPTVARSPGDAPIYVGYMDSLDKANINFNHPLWNQTTFKRSTHNGSPYLLDTMGCYWTEVDMVAYSKSMFKKANCPTPQELDAQGNWTFDNYLMVGKKTAEIDGCTGAAYLSLDCLLHAAGGAVYRLDENNRIVSGIDDKTIGIFQKIAQGQKDKYLGYGNATRGLIENTVSITTTHLWSLRKDGSLASHPNYNDLGFYYLPAFEKGGERPVTGIFRGWGIIKGCNKNPETGPKAAVAGAIFLSEYLDVNNYDLNNAFLTEEAKTFFFKLCDLYAKTNNYNPYYTYGNHNEGISGIDDDLVVYNVMNIDPAQIPSMMESVKSNVQYGVDNFNKYIDQNTR